MPEGLEFELRGQTWRISPDADRMLIEELLRLREEINSAAGWAVPPGHALGRPVIAARRALARLLDSSPQEQSVPDPFRISGGRLAALLTLLAAREGEGSPPWRSD